MRPESAAALTYYLDIQDKSGRPNVTVMELDAEHAVVVAPNSVQIYNLNVGKTDDAVDVAKESSNSVEYAHMLALETRHVRLRKIDLPNQSSVFIELPESKSGLGSGIQYLPLADNVATIDYEERLASLKTQLNLEKANLAKYQLERASACNSKPSALQRALGNWQTLWTSEPEPETHKPYDVEVRVAQDLVNRYQAEIEVTEKYRALDDKTKRSLAQKLGALKADDLAPDAARERLKALLRDQLQNALRFALDHRDTKDSESWASAIKSCRSLNFSPPVAEVELLKDALVNWRADEATESATKAGNMGTWFWDGVMQGVQTAPQHGP